jgi:hypothetical protein
MTEHRPLIARIFRRLPEHRADDGIPLIIIAWQWRLSVNNAYCILEEYLSLSTGSLASNNQDKMNSDSSSNGESSSSSSDYKGIQILVASKYCVSHILF